MRVQRDTSILIVERHDLDARDGSARMILLENSHVSVSSGEADLPLQTPKRNHQAYEKLDKADLVLLHARFRTARREWDHELEREEAVGVGADGLP